MGAAGVAPITANQSRSLTNDAAYLKTFELEGQLPELEIPHYVSLLHPYLLSREHPYKRGKISTFPLLVL